MGFTTSQFLSEIQTKMTEMECEPEQFQGRIIFMSMFNATLYGEKKETKQCVCVCVANSEIVLEHARAEFLLIFFCYKGAFASSQKGFLPTETMTILARSDWSGISMPKHTQKKLSISMCVVIASSTMSRQKLTRSPDNTTCVSCRSCVLQRCIVPSTATAVPHFPREMINVILLVLTEGTYAGGVHGLFPSHPTWTRTLDGSTLRKARL